VKPTPNGSIPHTMTRSTAVRAARWAQWGIVGLAGTCAWSLMMFAAVWRGGYIALLFPAGWCLYVALRQYRALRRSG